MAEPGTASAIQEANDAMIRAAQRLSEMPDLQRDLTQFYHMWGLDGYTPPQIVVDTVRNLVGGMLAASLACGTPE